MKVLIIILQLTIAISISAQRIEIKGKIVDNETNPLPFCHVSYGKNDGTVSNSEGDFSLIIPDSYFKNSIVISYVG